MFPEKLEVEKFRAFWHESDIFKSDHPRAYVHAFLHADYIMGMHSHEFYELNFVVRGSGRHYLASKSVPVKQGDVFIIPPEVSHGYLPDENLDVRHLLIRKPFFKHFENELQNTPAFRILFEVEPFLRQSTSKPHFLHLDENALKDAESTLDEIARAEKNGYHDYANVLVLSLICKSCVAMHAQLALPENSPPTINIAVIRAMEYAQIHIREKLTLETLALRAKVSTATLNRLFKKTLNASPMEYVTAYRISLARAMLREKKQTKTEIARACGFFDLSHMNKYLRETES